MAEEQNEILFEVVPLNSSNLSSEILSELCNVAAISKISNGIAFIFPEKVNPAPTTLLPSPMPRYMFNRLKELQTDFNDLYHNVAMDSEFLATSLGKVVNVDPFCGKLMNIMKKRELLENEGRLHKCQLGLFRADYMFEEIGNVGGSDGHKWRAKQIEVNTIASSFLGLAPEVASLHKSVISHLAGCSVQRSRSEPLQTISLPRINSSLEGITQGLISAHNYYCESISPSASSDNRANISEAVAKCIVMVVSETENNHIDQIKLKDNITNTSGVLVYRMTLAQLGNKEECWVDEENGTFLMHRGCAEVSVFYFRTAYSPEQLKTQQEWAVRENMELSLAINCPSVRYQLAGTKKVQQVLACKDSVEKFVKDAEIAQNIRSTFAQFLPLESDDKATTELSVKTALKNPSKYVLKPQREGGGNNYFDQDLVDMLNKFEHSDELNAYILMERVFPVTNQNIMACCNYGGFGSEDTTWSRVVSELGIYGVILSDKEGKVIINKESGHLLRSKDVSKKDGGVVAGNACLDSPYFV